MNVKIKIGNRYIGEQNSCIVIAEAGSNHNGNLDLGKKLIDAAKKCGCDAVKFQAFKTKNLVTRNADKAEYQKGKSSGISQSQFEMLRALELSQEEHFALFEHARAVGIPLLYSVFDEESADLVEELGVNIFKLGSGELTNIPLIKYIANKSKPLILSTGMGTDEEILEAVNAFKEKAYAPLLLMHCSTGYPSRLEDANLRRIKYLEKKFAVLCGNSDHTKGILVSVIAAALGTPFIEKHFTLDKNLAGPDHPMSMDPQEMKKLCGLIRMVEKNPVSEDDLYTILKKLNIDVIEEQIELILGEEDRILSEVERNQRVWARKSLVAARDINKDEILTPENLAIKRPEEGILPGEYEKVLGKSLRYSIEEGTPIKWEMLE